MLKKSNFLGYNIAIYLYLLKYKGRKMKNKYNKSERISFITKTLVENPSKIITLNYFSEQLFCSKSSIYEDIDLISKLFEEREVGKICSISGASGGIYYLPIYTDNQIEEIKINLCKLLNDKRRIITGGYLYMNDIFYDPGILKEIAKIMVKDFINKEIDYVVTIETKGIPLASILGSLLNVPIIVVRKSARLTEGPTIQMNYLAGSTKAIKTMALPLRALKEYSKVIFVDDFMKAGGTAKGVIDLMKEFKVDVIGVSVVLATKDPVKKLVNNYFSLIELDYIDEDKQIIKVYPKK